jgi:sterol desaturase/sphingolipid hydroxylase (fatty acid hydroxylase superfamily)
VIVHLLALVAGAFAWTLAEYLLHRFDGHGMRGRTRFSAAHLRHHTDPSWFAPAHLKALMAAVVVPPVAALAAWLTGPPGATFTLGFVVMYLAYEVLHRRIHTHAPGHAYAAWARRHHLQHHFCSPKHNHGVTTSLWDHVFRTWMPSATVRVPRRHAPPWMVDAATGDLRPEWAAQYTLRGRSSRGREGLAAK